MKTLRIPALAPAIGLAFSTGAIAGTRREAREDTVDARHDVDQEKCDSLAGDAKDRCIDAAKMRAGK